MRWLSLSQKIEYRIRIVLLGIAVLACVALPYGIIRHNADATLEASNLVVHTAEVKEQFHQLRRDMIEIENNVISTFAQVPRPSGRIEYDEARKRIPPMLERLSEATKDNADQQNRIGALGALVEGRLKLFDAAMQAIDRGNYDGAALSIAQAAELFDSREQSRQILDFESQLFVQRSERLASVQRRGRWAMVGALFAQLLLLASVIFVSERQTLHRRAAESRARHAVERSRLIVQSLREPIAVLDPGLRLLMANEAFREFYGAADGEEGGVHLGDTGEGSWDDRDLLQRLTDVAARGREIWDYELEQRSVDGVERVVLVNARRMDLSDDATENAERSILLTVSDVTARKRNDERIKELNENLEAQVEQVSEVNRELESFSYSVSHDLRAPLRHIAGFTDKLGAHIDASSDEKARHYLEVIGDAARRMSILIENLLEYSRLGRSALRMRPVDMDELVEEVRRMFHGDIAGRAVSWKVGKLPAVVGDEIMLRQVWQNLIGNAIKYTSGREQARIEISADSSRSDEVVYSVRDNGTGFDMAYAAKLFGVFQRLHKASEFPGTGIGLANVRRIVGRHGGRVWADSRPDRGATFHFSLPARTGAVPAQESSDES